MKAIIIEDEPKNLRILKDQVINYCPNIKIIGTAQNINDALQCITELKPDLIFLDIEMPYGNAFDLLANIETIDFEIIFITAFSEYAIKAIKYSAIDYLLKPIDIDDLIDAVKKAEQRIGDKSINNKVKILLESMNPNSGLNLTNREREIIDLLRQGKASKQIAAALGITKNTVDNHRQRLLKKFGVTSSAELVIKALTLN